jgi:Spy/CpxP family protein refolding chaperone
MDVLKQNKLLFRLIILLVIMNLAIVAFLMVSKSTNPSDARRPDRNIEEILSVLKEELQLSPAQVSQLKDLREDFFVKETKLKKVIKSQRDSMNELMFNAQTDTIMVKAIAKRVSENEFKMEMLRFDQAKKLKTICTPTQMKKFEVLVIDIRDYFKPRKK